MAIRALTPLKGAGSPPPGFVDTYSLSFDGVDEYCDLGANYAFERTDSFSWSFWYKSTVASAAVISNESVGTAHRGYAMVFDSGQWFFALSSVEGVSSLVVGTTTFVTDANWHHIVFTYSGGSNPASCKIYIDGTSYALTTYANTLTTTIVTAEMLNFGRHNYGGYYAGNLDEIAVFSAVVLSAGNVTTLYNSGTPTDVSLFSPSASSWWRMGDSPDTSSVINDRIGAINATPVNMSSGNIVADVP